MRYESVAHSLNTVLLYDITMQITLALTLVRVRSFAALFVRLKALVVLCCCFKSKAYVKTFYLEAGSQSQNLHQTLRQPPA
jgi:hypothetical protein